MEKEREKGGERGEIEWERGGVREGKRCRKRGKEAERERG